MQNPPKKKKADNKSKIKTSVKINIDHNGSLTFKNITRNEIIVFCIINGIFIMSDTGAIYNGFFTFSTHDVGVLPYYERFMWGFYLLHAHRVIGGPYPRYFDKKALLLAVLFTMTFSTNLPLYGALGVSAVLLLIALYYFHERKDYMFTAYLASVGLIIECVGLYFNLWSYSTTNYFLITTQIIIMWGASGLFFRHLAGPYIQK